MNLELFSYRSGTLLGLECKSVAMLSTDVTFIAMDIT